MACLILICYLDLSEHARQIRSAGDDAALPAKLSALSPDLAAPTSANGSGVVPNDGDSRTPKRVPNLDGVRIPGKQPATIRRRVRALYAHCSWLQPADLNAVLRYVRIMDRFLRKMAYLDKLPPVRPDKGDIAPRKMDADLRADSAELTKLESALGITASARAARMRAVMPRPSCSGAVMW